MKKILHAASVVPSLLIVSSMVFAAEGVTQLSDVSDNVKQILQEQKDSQTRPLPQGWQPGGFPGNQPGGNHGQPGNDHGGQQPWNPGQPPQPGHPGQPNHPGQPGQPGQPPQPPQPPAPVDTTHARNEGLRDGAEAGAREGRQRGYSDGVEFGEREGRRRGTDEGDSSGRQSGYRDGYGVDQSMGTQKGNYDGQSAGTTNGTASGQKRCYDEGYTNGYNSAFAAAKQLGLQDAASYSAGFASGQADAATIEAANGQKAGYQAGFSQREAELQNSSLDTRGYLAKGAMTKGATTGLPIQLARNGYATPQEQQAYQAAYQEGYRNGYQRSYEDAKRQGYNERFQMAYRRAYDAQFSVSYRNGFAEGKAKGYQDAYNSAYNASYNAYYDQYSGREYSDQRALGMNNGQALGTKEGFAAGAAEQTKLGYKAGYEKTAAAVYPGAFEAGKQTGIASADKYYSENAVLKVFNVAFYDENNNGAFEASENIMMKAEVRNFGFQKSDAVAVTVKSERGEITLVPDLKADGVGARAKTVLTFKVGKLYDVVAPDADALVATFSEKGALVGDARQMYTRTNPNKVGVVSKDGVSVRKGTHGIFSSEIAKLDRGAKVIITGDKNGYWQVRKSEVMGGDWTEGYINQDKVNLQ
jgi:hypothetical protein